MTAYYNENDKFAAAWLRNLIAAGVIAPGDVDERSIEDVLPMELTSYTQCHLFAGIGVWSYSMRCAGWADDRRAWSASCPCQPFSEGGKGAGFADERHLWPAAYHLVSQCEPDIIFGEQVASADGIAWLDLVQSDMETAHYAFGAVVAPAAGFGAPHVRHRTYWVAYANHARLERLRGPVGNELRTNGQAAALRAVGNQPSADSFWGFADRLKCRDGKWRSVEAGTFPLADGVAHNMGLLRGYGNAIVAPQAEEFIRVAMQYAP